jgi:hypothetical protein
VTRYLRGWEEEEKNVFFLMLVAIDPYTSG